MDSLGTRILRNGFGCPRGLLGRVGGWLMARGNAATERHVVSLAALGEHDVVVVLGHGPGIGLEAAGTKSRHVIGIEPSKTMRDAAARRCKELIREGRVTIRDGAAESTSQPEASVDVVLAVNNVQIWPDWQAAFAELHRVLRPGGRMLLSAHRKWLPDGLEKAVEDAGFQQVETSLWDPPSHGADTAFILRATRA
ncbi:class I SAM-dependent methyltransferase [Kibdelosporangium aridum]|uniref:Methyltransferase domain-containing protein n=1 Tax=Kibdelosporangium aridum TaxID=2030 RepID=A0A1Y5Y2S6_KIBAR|nr:class I SAM-dependent methyltransferase [Kibdelosporangium aridum]SMD22071.1 Methyltransferase domain-containing protein [Kibdelosporangium aridum]